jgi:hypothetical protein
MQALLLGCKSRSEPTGAKATAAAASACPTEEFMEELHASAFRFQHGPIEGGRRHLERARDVAPVPADAVSTKIVGQLSEIARRIESDPMWAQRETEHVRIAFGDWSCLPQSTHDRFHARLPPIR